MRPTRSYAIFAGWFAVIGPFVALPVPILLLGAHVAGFVPAVFTGIALAHRYRRVPVPTKACRRALSGLQVGFTVTFFCAVLAAIAYRLSDMGLPGVPVRMWLEDSGNFAIGFSLIGSVAGAFAFAVMPARLRGPCAPPVVDAQDESPEKGVQQVAPPVPPQGEA